MDTRYDLALGEAVVAIEEDLGNGGTFEYALDHFANHFEVDRRDLRREWNVHHNG